MYCVRCGVELGNSEKKCPLCGTPVYNPDINECANNYPSYNEDTNKLPRYAIMLVLTLLYIIPFIICILVDLKISHSVGWSGIVGVSGLAFYLIFLLPAWFNKPNPVIFIPLSFVEIGGLLLYIDLYFKGKWFLTLAFPIVVGLGIVITAASTLFKYLKKGRLFVLGGVIIALAAMTIFVEFFISITFKLQMFTWSLYPFLIFFILGILVLIIASNKKMNYFFRKKFFL